MQTDYINLKRFFFLPFISALDSNYSLPKPLSSNAFKSFSEILGYTSFAVLYIEKHMHGIHVGYLLRMV